MNILVFAEVRDGKLKKSSLETLSEAVRLAKPLGSKVGVALVGEGVKAHAEALGKHGAAQVFAVDSPRLKYYASEAYAKAVVAAHQKLGSGAILMAATSMGRDLAGGVAALLGTGAATAAAMLGWTVLHVSGTDTVLYRGGMAGVAVAVAAVIARVVVAPTGLSARLLSLPPLPALGRISYGVYLWHWPVFIAANAGRTGLDGPTLLAVRCALTLGIASLSYVLLERPIHRRVRPTRPLLAASGALSAVASGAAVLVVTTAVPPLPALPAETSVGTAVDRFLAGDGDDAAGREQRGPAEGPRKRASGQPRSRPAPPLHHRRPGQPVVVDVFGDSVAWTLVNYLPSHPELVVHDRTLMGCGVSRTAPFRYAGVHHPRLMPACRDWPAIWQAAIARDDPDVALVLVGRWETMDRVLDGRWTHIGDAEFDAHLRSELDLAIRVAGARGAHVLLATEPYNRRWEQLDGSLYPEDEPPRVTAWKELLREVARSHPQVRVVDLGARISPEGRFTWTAGGYQVRSDGLHLTPSGVQGWIAPWLLPQLVAAVPR
jgi:hypothetical protein